MFGAVSKMAVITVGAVLTAAAVGLTGYCIFGGKVKWDPEKAEQVFDELVQAQNDAIGKYPSDRYKACFAFEQAAQGIRNVFKTTYGEFEEYATWEGVFEQRARRILKSIRTSV